MGKNVADLYNFAGDSSAVEQRFYAKLESTRGQLQAPVGADFFFTLAGGSVEFQQPYEVSPHRSGRHNNNIIKKKKETTFSFSTYFNINESLGSFSAAEIDTATKLLWKSLLGKETVGGSSIAYQATTPDLTFSLYEVGDRWARQTPGAFVMGGNVQLPGNGEATVEWSGNGKTVYYAGIGKSTIDNDGANTVTLQSGEGELFDVGAIVMLVESDGLTRSADTPDGSPRTITAINGDVITLSGAALADADGSVTPLYLSYYEPATPVAIDNPVTGLTGSMTVAGLTHDCFRNFGLNIQNNHELVDYCYGSDSLAGSLFVPGARVNMEVTLEMNLNKETLKFFNRVKSFEAQDLLAVLGAASGRRAEFDLPKVIFNVPSFAVPETGSLS